jgi:hypothetical protein
MGKKKWKTPELIVFVKSSPEDSILSHCKGNGALSPGATGSTRGNHCQGKPKENGKDNCGACHSNGGGIS